MFAELGWSTHRDSDGVGLSLELGTRQIKMFPVLKRVLRPMIFRPQASLLDDDYTAVCEAVTGLRGGAAIAFYRRSFETTKFDTGFVSDTHEAITEWSASFDPKEIDVWLRNLARLSLSSMDLIKMAYVRQTAELEGLLTAQEGEGRPFFHDREDPVLIERAIEASKRPA